MNTITAQDVDVILEAELASHDPAAPARLFEAGRYGSARVITNRLPSPAASFARCVSAGGVSAT